VKDRELQLRRFHGSRLESAIFIDFPPIVFDFSNQSQRSKIDGHSPTITAIEMMNGFIFGNSIVLLYESRIRTEIGNAMDESISSFIFILKNSVEIQLQTIGESCW
jgi:hypothetical protein